MGTKKIPMRMCTGCREMKPKGALIRIVKTPEGEIRLDRTGKLNGRGAYVCKNPECLKKCQHSKRLERSLEVEIPDEVYDALREELNRNES